MLINHRFALVTALLILVLSACMQAAKSRLPITLDGRPVELTVHRMTDPPRDPRLLKHLETSPTQFITRDRHGWDRLVYRTVLLSNVHVAAADATPPRGDSAGLIHVTLTAEGSEQLRKLSQALIGQQIGFFLNGKLISAATVRNEIADGKLAFVVPGGTGAELEQIARGISPKAS